MTESLVDRDELRTMARGMLDEVSDSATVRRLMDPAAPGDPALWRQFTEVGWPTMEIPDAYDGAGASFGDVAVILVELGRHLTPSPLASSLVLGTGALLLGGNEGARARWLPRLAAGGAVGTAALGAVGAAASPTASPDGDGMIISGVWDYVPDADVADFVVLSAAGAQGTVLALVEPGAPGLRIEPVPMMDPTRRVGRVVATEVRVGGGAVLATGAAGARLAAALADRAALGAACDSLGVAERALTTTVDYAKQRMQFGRAIGSFQAVKHRCTNMLIAVETTRVAVNDAIAAIDRDPFAAALPVSAAKAYAGDAAAQVAADAVTLHGGIGFTWEHDCHLMLKRAKLNQAQHGSTRWHRRRVADLVFG